MASEIIDRVPGPLYFITMDDGPMDHLRQVEMACEAGVRWIQMRMKEVDDMAFRETAKAAMRVCAAFGSHLILNDRVGIACELKGERGFAGVHLGLEDMGVAEARVLLGADCIIGGTANTLEDVVRHALAGADYVGVGPYRYTSTKKKLSPLLGLEGYRRILEGMGAWGLGLPVIAIGGIEAGDVAGLMDVGVYGVAFSGMLVHAGDKAGLIRGLLLSAAG